MSKGSRNRQQARARVAEMRAAEERRQRRRKLTLLGSAAAAVVLVIVIVVVVVVSSSGGSGNGGGTAAGGKSAPQLKLASLSSLGPLRPAGAAGATGPEGVPIPSGPALASTAGKATGQTVDGIQCQTNEQTIFHIHAHLTVYVNGAARQIPAAVGIPGAQPQSTPQGPFIGSGTCFYWLHTHAADGIIHVESPVHRTYTLGNFFDEWRQPLSPTQVGPVKGKVVAIYNGQRYVGNPRDIPLNAHAQIQLEVGTPLVAPQHITFPNGL